MRLTKQSMPETLYRASCCCRVLGNPTGYLIVRCLGGQLKTPNDLSQEMKIPLSTISMILRHLRQMDIVRYETKGKSKEYWVKDPTLLGMLNTIEKWVESMREKRD
jgi:transcription initiation factor IIE alpha subunit